ncbi:sugar phosphate isomerase/epimerase family protein [Streptomyces nogalater]
MNPDLARFSVNQMTVKQLSLPELTDACARLGITHVGLWREPVQAYGVEAAAKLVRDAGLTVTTLCRGGFLTATDPVERAEALGDNHAAIEEAAALGTDTLVLVSGGLPLFSKDLHGARERIADALAVLAPYAAERGVRLAIEPLHPMYAADRCVVSTLTQALDLAERFPADQVGVAVDTYHIWWDDQAPAQIARAGAAGRIHTFQLADWTTPAPRRPQRSRPDRRRRDRHARMEGLRGVGRLHRPDRSRALQRGVVGEGRKEVLAETAERFLTHVIRQGA